MATRLSRAVFGLRALRGGDWNASATAGPLIRVLSMDDRALAADPRLDRLVDAVVPTVDVALDPGSTDPDDVALWHLLTAVLIRVAALEDDGAAGERDAPTTAQRAAAVAQQRRAAVDDALDPSLRLTAEERTHLRDEIGDGTGFSPEMRGLAALAGPPDEDEASLDALAMVLRWVDEALLRRILGGARTHELASVEPVLWARAVGDIDLAEAEGLLEGRLDATGFTRLARGAWVVAARAEPSAPWINRMRARTGGLVRRAFSVDSIASSVGSEAAVTWLKLHHQPFSTLPSEHDYHVGNVHALMAELRILGRLNHVR